MTLGRHYLHLTHSPGHDYLVFRKPSSTVPESPALLCKLTSLACPQWTAGAGEQWCEEGLCCHTAWVGNPAPALSCEAHQAIPEPQNGDDN